ncbi:MAG: hypothetical protein J6P13_01850 [Kiritimatiellae bacterium]|nr:hypothetical protein [Kiritimatiellia bacterium]
MKSRGSVAFGFLALIFIGAILLASPWARTQGGWGGWQAALFTSFSAVCVTGLTIVEIAAEYTRAGQIVIITLVEIGCLGLMTCGTFLLVAIGRRLSLSREFSLMNAYGVEQIQGLRGLICWVVGSMLTVELVWAAIMYPRFAAMDPGNAAYLSLFYSVMGFCNAGFGILPGSLAPFANDHAMLLVLAAETILGGIGFLVIYNLCTFKFLRRKTGGAGRLSLHTKVVLRVSLFLLAFAFLAFLVLEWNGVLKDFPFWNKFSVAFYQAVTPRTCGFCVTPTESLKPVTRLMYETLMMIGGAPGSAAAGIKVTTFAVLVYTIKAMCSGESETVISRRLVPNEIVRESFVIAVALLTILVMVTAALFVTEAESGIALDALFFEAVSAITTTGLSVADTTARLSASGKMVIMAAMFAGRLGALSVVMLIGDRESKRHVRFPTEELVVG